MRPALTINNRDFSSRLATMLVSKEVTYKSVITTRDGIEKPSQQRIRTIIDFSLLPASGATIALDFACLQGYNLTVVYFDPYTNSNQTKTMRVEGAIENAFTIDAVDGKMYYTGKPIKLRQNGVG